jgi:hypothetical protein
VFPPQKSMFWNQSIDSIQPKENNKSSTLSGVGLCKDRLEPFDNKNNTQYINEFNNKKKS